MPQSLLCHVVTMTSLDADRGDLYFSIHCTCWPFFDRRAHWFRVELRKKVRWLRREQFAAVHQLQMPVHPKQVWHKANLSRKIGLPRKISLRNQAENMGLYQLFISDSHYLLSVSKLGPVITSSFVCLFLISVRLPYDREPIDSCPCLRQSCVDVFFGWWDATT